MTSNVTTSISDSTKPAKGSQLLSLRTLHIFTLCAFAVTEPILTALADRTVYLHDLHFGWGEIVVLLAVLLIAIPLVFVAVDWVCQRIAQYSFGWGRNFTITLLMTAVLLSTLRPYFSFLWQISITWQIARGMIGYLFLIASFSCSCFLTLLYDRSKWMRSWLTIVSIGLVLFPAVFCGSGT